MRDKRGGNKSENVRIYVCLLIRRLDILH